jgi:hypothetical protein
MITCSKPIKDTSGKIISYYELFTFKKHWLAKYCWNFYDKKMKEMYGEDYIDILLKYYHRNNSENFPILIELQNIVIPEEMLKE